MKHRNLDCVLLDMSSVHLIVAERSLATTWTPGLCLTRSLNSISWSRICRDPLRHRHVALKIISGTQLRSEVYSSQRMVDLLQGTRCWPALTMCGWSHKAESNEQAIHEVHSMILPFSHHAIERQSSS